MAPPTVSETDVEASGFVVGGAPGEEDSLAELGEGDTLFAHPGSGLLTLDPHALPSLEPEPPQPRPPLHAGAASAARSSRAHGPVRRWLGSLVALAATAAVAADPGHSSTDLAASTRQPWRSLEHRSLAPDPDETDDVHDDYMDLLTLLSEQDVCFSTEFGHDPSSTPSPPTGGTREALAGSDLFVHLVTGATPDNVARPLADEISSYDWDGVDERFLAGAHPDPFHVWERGVDFQDFFTGRAAAFHALRPSGLDLSELLARPADSFTFAEVAPKFGYTADELEFILDGDRSNLKRFAAVALSHDEPLPVDPAAPPPPPEPPDSRLALEEIPQPPPPPVTEPDVRYDGGDRGVAPPQFWGTFSFYSMFIDPTDARERIERWEREFREDAERCHREHAQGLKPRSRFKRVELFSSAEFHPFIVGKQVNCLDHENCFIEPDQDRPVEEDGIDWRRVILDLGGEVPSGGCTDWDAVIRNHPFPDKQLLSNLMYGYHHRSRQPWCLCLAPYNGSAAANLPVVAKAVGKGIKAGHLTESPGITALPLVAEPYGVAYKRHTYDPASGGGKPRLTTDCSGPRDILDPVSGLPVADNANVDVKVDHPPMRLVTVPEIRKGLAVLSAAADQLGRAVDADPSIPADQKEKHKRESGQVFMACDDFAGYFSQFHVRHRLRSRRAMAFVHGDGRLAYTTSSRVQFGGSTAPQHAQRFTNAVLHRVRARLLGEDARLDRHAELYEQGLEGGHALASLVSPRALRALVAERRKLRGEEQGSLFFLNGYIDDIIVAAPGQARAMIILNTLWSTCDQFNVKLAPDKASFGTRCTVLGFDFRLKTNRFSLTENRRHLFGEWFRRLRGLRGRRIARTELRALAGCLVWARPALPGAGLFYRRLFGLLNAPSRSLIQPAWLEFDLDQLEDILNETDGEALIRIPPPPPTVGPDQLLWTDAAREIDSPSAMGGFTTATGQLWKWTFDEQHVRHLPIHVLEAVGSVTALALAANTLKGQTVVAYCDNNAWCKSVQGGAPKDPRLREILAIHHQICRQFDLTVHVKYVHTDTNLVADAASRHREDEALAELESKGWDRADVRSLDLNAHPELGPSDLTLLLDRMVQMTVARTLHRKKLKEHTWA